MLENILEAANKYAFGVKRVQGRRDSWLKKYTEIKDKLTQIADYLNTNATYKQEFFVDVLHAYNEEINGTSASIPSITFRSGAMPMLVTFRNSMGEKKTYTEEGFRVSFNPTITGQIVVLLLPHHNPLDQQPPQYTTLAFIDDPAQLTADAAAEIIARGIDLAFYTSFTGITENKEEANEIPRAPIAHTPIGFKLHETTEKVK
jgi:hypothetical protein